MERKLLFDIKSTTWKFLLNSFQLIYNFDIKRPPYLSVLLDELLEYICWKPHEYKWDTKNKVRKKEKKGFGFVSVFNNFMTFYSLLNFSSMMQKTLYHV